jgi:hypothetical protein
MPFRLPQIPYDLTLAVQSQIMKSDNLPGRHVNVGQCCFYTDNVERCYEGLLNPESPEVAIYTTYFNITKFCILPTECSCVFCMVLTINSDCFPKQH